MNPYFCTIKVSLKEAVRATMESGERYGFLVGYYRNIGVCAENISRAMDILKSTVDDGVINWDETVVHDFEKVQPKISDKFSPNGEPIWYTSGRMFFPADSESN